MVFFGGLQFDTVTTLGLAELAYILIYQFSLGRAVFTNEYVKVFINVFGAVGEGLLLQLIIGSYSTYGLSISTRATGLVSAHTSIWLMIAMSIAIISIIPLRYKDLDITRGIVVTAGLNGIHEIYWYAAYFIVHPADIITNYYYYAPFIMLEFSFWFMLIWRYPELHKQILKDWLPVWIGYYALWIFSGFPITLDLQYGQYGAWYGIAPVDFIEVVSWFLYLVAPQITYIRYTYKAPTRTVQHGTNQKGRREDDRTGLDPDNSRPSTASTDGQPKVRGSTGSSKGMEQRTGHQVRYWLPFLSNYPKEEARRNGDNDRDENAEGRQRGSVLLPTQVSGSVLPSFFLNSQKTQRLRLEEM